MIRPFTCVCILLAAGSGLYLYQAKHRAHLLDRAIEDVVHKTEQARARTGLLQAEWQLLNDTDRLRQLSDKFLTLRPTAPTQFVAMADLAEHLPPVRVPEQHPAEPDPDEGAPSPDPAPLAQIPPVAVPPVAAEKSRTMVAVAKPVAKPPERKPSPPDAESGRVGALETRVVTHPAVAAAPTSISVTRVATAPTPIPLPRPVIERPAVRQVAAPAIPMVASSLGMARTMLPAPVPLGRSGNPADQPGGG